MLRPTQYRQYADDALTARVNGNYDKLRTSVGKIMESIHSGDYLKYLDMFAKGAQGLPGKLSGRENAPSDNELNDWLIGAFNIFQGAYQFFADAIKMDHEGEDFHLSLLRFRNIMQIMEDQEQSIDASFRLR
jgi:hypothetical protein